MFYSLSLNTAEISRYAFKCILDYLGFIQPPLLCLFIVLFPAFSQVQTSCFVNITNRHSFPMFLSSGIKMQRFSFFSWDIGDSLYSQKLLGFFLFEGLAEELAVSHLTTLN